MNSEKKAASEELWGLPLTASAILMCLMWVLWFVLDDRDEASLRRLIQQDSVTAVTLIKSDIRMRVPTLQRMVKRWEQKGGMSVEDWSADAYELIANLPGFQAIEWVDSTFHVRWVVPTVGNEAASGLNLAFEERRRQALEQARDSRLPTLSRPVNLVQGGKGLLLYIPIYLDTGFDGFILAVFRTQEWLDYVLSHNKVLVDGGNLQIQVSYAGETIYSTNKSDATDSQHLTVSEDVAFLDTPLRVEVTPTNSYLQNTRSSLSLVIVIAGALLSLLVAYVIYLSQRNSQSVMRYSMINHSLKQEMIGRQRVESALQESEGQNRAVFEAVLDGIITIDVTGIIKSANPAAQAMYGYHRDEMVGRNVKMLMAENIAAEHDGYIRNYLNTGQRKIIGIGREVCGLRKDGTEFPASLAITEAHVAGEKIFVGLMRDITDRKKAEEEIMHMATHDALTNMPGMRLARDRVEKAIDRAERAGSLLAVMFLDLDGFKAINDTHGHAVGDQVLREVAIRLTDSIRHEDTAARMGGDEFLLVLNQIKSTANASQVAEKVIDVIGQTYCFDELQLELGVSIGISFFPQDGQTADELITAADGAMYTVKQLGKNNHAFASLESVEKIAGTH